MKKVLTFGVFDLFHYGHKRLLERCKKYGDFLIVAIQIDEQVKINKPDTLIIDSFDTRVNKVSSLEIVDMVIPYTQVDDTIKKVIFDVLVVGEDQNHLGFMKAIEWCKSNNKDIVVLKRTPNISSTILRKEIKK